jgi:CheY-like chemotaxis protein
LLRAWRMDAQQLAISVRDNGVGIAPETLPKVFELFVQGERGADRAEGGLGIGLAIVRSLVELHGGSVQARSEGLGKGCEFVVYLPAQAMQDDAGACAVNAPREWRASQARRILLVDDNADAAETLGELLEAAGHEVTVFTDPVSVLKALPRLQPEFAVLDIGLPVMDGYELAARLREAYGDRCTLIALSGYGQENDRTRSREAGFDRHLVKPVEPDRLIRLLDSGD